MRRNALKIGSILLLMLFLLSGTSYAFYTDSSNPSIEKATLMENRKPNPPEITGQSSGKINTLYTYSFYLTDPDGDELKAIQIEWGGVGIDNTTYICFVCEGGPLPNGSIFEHDHYWADTGTYTIRAKVWDTPGNESDWGTLTITMPCSYNKPVPRFLELLFQRFPHAFPLLRHVMG